MSVEEALSFARAQIGKPYRLGAEGPDAWDCSGLVQKSCEAGGVNISRTTYTQIFDGHEVKREELQPGDLVFPDSGHVQLYSGNGYIIEAPTWGESVRERTMWGFWRARRVFTGDTTSTPVATLPASNPLDKIPVLGQLDKLAQTLDSAAFWKKTGVAVLGLFLIVVGIVFVNRRAIGTAVIETAKTSAKVGEVAAL